MLLNQFYFFLLILLLLTVNDDAEKKQFDANSVESLLDSIESAIGKLK